MFLTLGDLSALSRGIRLMKTIRPTIAVLGLVAATVGLHASDFSIDRTKIYLSKRRPAELVTLQNQSSEPLRIQLTAFRWTQPADQAMVLEPTEEVIFFPSVMRLEPGADGRVRVGFAGNQAPRELAFRLLIEELPSTEAQAANTVQVLTRLNVPVFMQPDRPIPVPVVGPLVREGATLVVPVRNDGTSHVMVEAITVTGTDATGRTVFSEEVPGWYVLADSARTFPVELPAACADATSFQVTVHAGDTTVRRALPGGQPCRP